MKAAELREGARQAGGEGILGIELKVLYRQHEPVTPAPGNLRNRIERHTVQPAHITGRTVYGILGIELKDGSMT